MDIGMNIFGVKPTETPLFVPKFPIPKNEKEFQNLLKDVVHWQELGEKEWIQDADEALAGYLSSPNTATSADLDLLIGLPLPKTHVALQPLLTKTLGIPLSSEATSCLDRLDDERQLLTQNPLSEEEEAQFSTALDDLKGTLATFRPSELFRLLQYVRTKSQHRSFVKPIFLKLCDYASRGELEEKRAKFLLKLAHQNGGLFAALGKGEDAWVVRMREEGTGKAKEYSCSRFLLVYSSDYFAALDAAIIQDKESEQEGVFDLSASSLKIEDFETFYNWLVLRQLPLPKADEEQEYFLKLQRLATFLTKAAFKEVEAHLQQEISVQTLASFVYVALKLHMPNLLESCIDFIELHYADYVRFERLNQCPITIRYETAQVPEEIRKALSLLMEKQKGLSLKKSVSSQPHEIRNWKIELLISKIERFFLSPKYKAYRLSYKAFQIATLTAAAGFSAYVYSVSNQVLKHWVLEHWNGGKVEESNYLSALYLPLVNHSYTIIGTSASFLTLMLSERILEAAETACKSPLKMYAALNLKAHQLHFYLKSFSERTIRFLKDPCGLTTATERAMQEAFSGRVVPALPKQASSFFIALEGYKGAEKTRTLDLSQCHDLEDEHLQYLVQACPNLIALKLGVNPKLTAEGYSSLKHLAKLNSLHIVFSKEKFELGSLNHLNISYIFGARSDFKLTLELYNLSSHLPAFPTPPFFQNIGKEIAVHANLQHFYQHPGFFDPRAPQAVDYLTRWCPHVLSLTTHAIALSEQDALFISQRWRQLRELWLNESYYASTATLLNLLRLPSLQTLFIEWGHTALPNSLTSELITSLVAHCPRLRNVEMTKCQWLTNESLQILATLPKLKRILIHDSPLITDAGVEALLDTSIPPVEVHLHRTPAVSSELLARAFETLGSEITAKAKVASLVTQQVFAEGFKGKNTQRHVEELFFGIFDFLIENNLFLDFSWPIDTYPLAFLEDANLRDVNPFRQIIAQFVREKFNIAPLSQPPKVKISFAQTKASYNADKRFKLNIFDSGSFKQFFKTKFAKIGKNLRKILDSTVFPEESLFYQLFFYDTFKVNFLKIHAKWAVVLAQTWPDFGLDTYYRYLKKARPQLNTDKIEGLQKELEEDLERLIQQDSERLKHLGMAIAHHSVGENAFSIFSEGSWRRMFKVFLGNIQKVGQQEKWSEQSKCAVLLGGALIFVTQLRKALFPKEEELLLSEDERLSALEGKREA